MQGTHEVINNWSWYTFFRAGIVWQILFLCFISYPSLGVAGTSKHERCIALGQKCSNNLERIRNMPEGTCYWQYQSIVFETRDLLKIYYRKYFGIRFDRKELRRLLEDTLANQRLNRVGKRVAREFNREVLEMMFPKTQMPHKCPNAIVTDDELNEIAARQRVGVLPTISRDIALCSIGVCMCYFPNGTVKGIGGGVIGTSGVNVFNTLFNCFYPILTGDVGCDSKGRRETDEQREIWMEGFRYYKMNNNDHLYNMKCVPN